MTSTHQQNSIRGSHPGTGTPLSRQATLTLAALGVVYGDIGTSPLYAMRQSVLATGGTNPDDLAVLGALSLVIWSLILVVTVKYVVFVLRADNKGEGGVLSLAALAHRSQGLPRWAKSAIGFAAVMGVALFFGDGLITPAITVLSALEGLQYEEPYFGPLVLPLSLAILVGTFLIQSRGTARIGKLFGPVNAIWFFSLGALGLGSILETPSVLAAVNPYYAMALFVREPWDAFIALGSVVLAVTGVEALYADMGHFGKRPLRIAWLYLVLPGLLLNYIGQGAAILRVPADVSHPFYVLAPEALHYPLVALATMVSVIACQAVISGIFSITQQAVQLGHLPQMEVRHTSATDYGQIYVPRANTLMLIGVVAIVLIYKNSGALASAYGLAVVGMMTMTTFLLFIVALKQWNWKPHWLFLAFGIFALIDLAFLSSVSLKIIEGAWLPIVIAVAVFLLVGTWRSGKRVLIEKTYGEGLPVRQFLERGKMPIRVAGTAVFVTGRLDEVPGALLHNLKHNQVLHERVILLRVDIQDVPFVPQDQRLTIDKLGKGFYTVEVHYGFFQNPDVPRALEAARPFGIAFDVDSTTFFVRRETLVRARRSAMRSWRTELFIRLHGGALPAARFFRLPPGRVVELGSQTEI